MNSVFIHIPKTAGLTIEKVLELKRLRWGRRVKKHWKNKGNVTFGHQPYIEMRNKGIISDEFHNSAFKYAFCRNPYERVVSHWVYTMKRHPDIVEPGTSFLEFTKIVPVTYKRAYGINMQIFRPQYEWIDGVDLDFLGRFETLGTDLRFIADRLNKKVEKIPCVNSTRHEKYWNYYCEESKQRIEDFYKIDFEKFGYDYDNTLLHRKQT